MFTMENESRHGNRTWREQVAENMQKIHIESAKWLDLNRHTQSLVAATNASITFSREIFVIQQ